MKLRAVLDTNVFVRMLFGKNPQGVAAALWQLLLDGAYELVLSEALLEELELVLTHSQLAAEKGWRTADVEPFLKSLKSIAPVVELRPLRHPKLEARDPDDLFLLQTARSGSAQFLVTQDPNLLELGRFEQIEILDPLAFLRILRAQASS